MEHYWSPADATGGEWPVRRAIAEGEAKPDGRLPPAKDLAAVLGVNTNTFCAPSANSATKAYSNSDAATASPSPAPPDRA
jgi:hypothetical protein